MVGWQSAGVESYFPGRDSRIEIVYYPLIANPQHIAGIDGAGTHAARLYQVTLFCHIAHNQVGKKTPHCSQTIVKTHQTAINRRHFRLSKRHAARLCQRNTPIYQTHTVLCSRNATTLRNSHYVCSIEIVSS